MLIGLLYLLSPLSSFALEPLDANGKIFGLEPATYEGGGTLESQNWLPNTKYHSVRKLEGGIIDAHTTASLFGFGVAEAGARLKIQVTGPGRFDMLDADDGEKKAGEGSCDGTSCSFKATVMGGSLTLEETWVPSAKGFDVVRGSQLFKGNPASYQGSFTKTDSKN